MSWHVLEVRSRSEEKAVKELKESGYKSFTPMTRLDPKTVGPHATKTAEPLFKTYVFIEVLSDFHTPILVTSVKKFVKSPNGYPAIMPQQGIDELWTRELSEWSQEPLSDWKVGDRARIKTGLLMDLEGIISMTQGERVCIILEALEGQAKPFEIDKADLITI